MLTFVTRPSLEGTQALANWRLTKNYGIKLSMASVPTSTRALLAAALLLVGGGSMAGAQSDTATGSEGSSEGLISVDAQAIADAQPEAEQNVLENTPAPDMVRQPVIQEILPEAEQQNTNSPASSTANKSDAPKSGEELVIKRILPIEGPIRYGEWFWDEDGVPPGKLIMTVDLDARVLSVFRDGYEIGATAVLLGTDEHPTPLGTFPILTKERHNVSEKYDNAPMPWTLRLTWDGIAIHGGSQIVNGYASHGCIAVPDEFASRLFDVARKGDKVVITRGKMIGMGDKII